LEASWKILERVGGVLEASWNVLERLGASWRRLGALLKAIWPDSENVEKPLCPRFLEPWPLLEASWSVLERLRGVLKRLGASWSCLGGLLEAS
jgi:hypothetical protein